MSEYSDVELADRWRHRVRFVIGDRGAIEPEWRYPELIPSHIRTWFERRVVEEGPSLGLIKELELAVLEAAGTLVKPGTELEAVLDQKGFRPWPLAEGGLSGF
jgi:hypothetical protein